MLSQAELVKLIKAIDGASLQALAVRCRELFRHIEQHASLENSALVSYQAERDKWAQWLEVRRRGGRASPQTPGTAAECQSLAWHLYRAISEQTSPVVPMLFEMYHKPKPDQNISPFFSDWRQFFIEAVESVLDADTRATFPPAQHVKVPSIQPAPIQTTLPRIFLVHGRDNAVKYEVARTIDQLGAKAVILHEEVNSGRTLITKFQEVAAQAAYAVVLMTPDDEGCLSGGALQPRARQNVIFELGFFIGLLGSHRVCALVMGDIERPSDYDGVIYIPFMSGDETWKIKLVKELRASGIAIDSEKLF